MQSSTKATNKASFLKPDLDQDCYESRKWAEQPIQLATPTQHHWYLPTWLSGGCPPFLCHWQQGAHDHWGVSVNILPWGLQSHRGLTGTSQSAISTSSIWALTHHFREAIGFSWNQQCHYLCNSYLWGSRWNTEQHGYNNSINHNCSLAWDVYQVFAECTQWWYHSLSQCPLGSQNIVAWDITIPHLGGGGRGAALDLSQCSALCGNHAVMKNKRNSAECLANSTNSRSS